MKDPTTDGYTATDAEIGGMVRNLCAYALGEPDPLQRYADLTHQQVLFDGIVAAIRRERGRALADVIVAGTPVADVVAKTNLASPLHVQKLIKAAGETERVKAAGRKPRQSKSAAPTEPAPDEPAPDEPAPDEPVPAVTDTGPLLPPVTAVTGKRVLTAAERLTLGLPPDGPIPRDRNRQATEATKR